jgi:hypothetical protein
MGAPPLESSVTRLAVDRELPDLELLIDRHWVWQTYQNLLTEQTDPPQRIRLRHFGYHPHTRAIVSYTAERRFGRMVVRDEFAVEMSAGKAARAFRFPDDPYLPGLPRAASAVEAQQLLSEYASLSPYRLKVETVRYRPGTRAVLRYTGTWKSRRVGTMRLFARVMPPASLSRFMSAMELAGASGFAIPCVVAQWEQGGVVLLPEVRGDNVRELISTGTPPEPSRVLDCLEKLWGSGFEPGQGCSLNLIGGYRLAKDVLSMLPANESYRPLLHRISESLDPFVSNWGPSALAHNDFYDDQMILTPEGQLALVDYEEIGPGDPMLDVANMLAHLRWAARFGVAPERCEDYHRQFRSQALARFKWDNEALALREGFRLFRLTADAFRRSGNDWAASINTGLLLTQEALERPH